MRLDAPAAQTGTDAASGAQRLETFGSLPLFPALPASVEWTCIKISASWWQFEARFFGEPYAGRELLNSPTDSWLNILEMP